MYRLIFINLQVKFNPVIICVTLFINVTLTDAVTSSKYVASSFRMAWYSCMLIAKAKAGISHYPQLLSDKQIQIIKILISAWG
jgi:hypothetical protein